jgi:beta-barrel assembly-enhancing protease
MKNYSFRLQEFASILIALELLISPPGIMAQGTRIQPPKNNYTVADDIKLGDQASAEVRKQLPLVPENSEIDQYVESVGRRLVAALPREFQRPEFKYRFDVVNAKEINAFALPGGPMYVNRGMIEAARSEGEMAGVMAHEISHVALRHGTAQASKASKFQLPALGGAILGAIIGGNVGGAIAQGTQLGLGAYMLKFSREYETQADLLGAQIMARAGYDPRDLANMFRTIQQQGRNSGPEWLSSHPDPGNRYARINEEAQRLRVARAGSPNSAEFARVQGSLRQSSPAQSMAEIARSRQQPSASNAPAYRRPDRSVAAPSTNYRTYSGGNLFSVNVPSNWQEFPGQNSVTFAPQGAFGNYQGQEIFTHGAIAGIANLQAQTLRQGSDQYISALLRSNPYLRAQGGYRRANIDGRNALSITLNGASPATGRNEIVTIYTSLLRNGALFYLINVAPQNESGAYNRVFNNILRSTSLNG